MRCSSEGIGGLYGHGIIWRIISSVSDAIRSTMWLTLIACEMWWMKKSSQHTQANASSMAPMTLTAGAKGCGSERAAGRAAMQYEKVPRNTPSVHCVTRSLAKLTMMRGENCIEASVSVINRIANTMETTVIIEAAMPARMTWAT